MHKVLGTFNRMSSLCSAGILFFIMLLMVADVTLRWFANYPVPGCMEFVKISMAAIVFLGLSYTEESGSHIRVEVLLGLVPSKLRLWFDILAWMAGLLLFGLIAWKGLEAAMESFQMKEYYPGEIRVPIYPARFLIVLGSVLICLQFISQIITFFSSESQKSFKEAVRD